MLNVMGASLPKRVKWVSLVAVLAVAIGATGESVRAGSSQAFAAYVTPAPPQGAVGDFDGDGRVDSARIERHAGASRLSIRLTSSSMVVDLDGSVTGVVQGDIDHDGDLDLVAATPSGDLLIWLNDGHGRFTRQTLSRPGDVSSSPVMGSTPDRDLAAVGASAPILAAPARRDTRLTVESVRTRSIHSSRAITRIALPPLRAPPVRSL